MKYIIEKSYNEFVGEYEVYPTQKLARAKGYEAHHIIPRAVQKRIAGTVYDDRCVRLTYFEHILAHYLYCKEHPEDKDEFFALLSMLNKRAKELLADEQKFLQELPDIAEMGKKGRESIYTEEWRRKISEANSHPSEETRKRKSLANKGKKLSEEHKRKLSISHKGKVTWNKGKKMSEEYTYTLSEAHSNLIYQRDLEGKLIKTFNSAKRASEILGVSKSTLHNYIHGKTPKNLSYTLSYN